MNVSYLNQLREQISETKKKGDPPLALDALIILKVVRTPSFSKGNWETQVSDILQEAGWERGGVDPPSFIFVLNETAHFYFPQPKSSMNVLISTTSSICTKVDPKLYQCSASHLTNIAEVLAYFVLETDHIIRTQAETLLETHLDHLTNKEFWKTLDTSPIQFDCPKQGIFYRLHKPNRSKLKEWKFLTNEKTPVVKFSKSISFDTFEENISLLFNRS